MGADKSAGFIKWNGKRTVSGTNLEDGILIVVGFLYKFDQHSAIAFPVEMWIRCNVFYLQNTITFIGDNTDPFDSIVVQYVVTFFISIIKNSFILLLLHVHYYIAVGNQVKQKVSWFAVL